MGIRYAAVLAIFCAGCLEQGQPQVKSADIEALRADIQGLRTEIADLKLAQSALEMDDIVDDWAEIAFLRPADTGWSPIRFSLGVLTIQMADVKPYANGSKVSLVFGNTLATTISGLAAKIEWGPVDANGSPTNGATKAKDIKFNEEIRSGKWTTVPLVLDGVSPSDLGFVRVSNLSFSGILLNKK